MAAEHHRRAHVAEDLLNPPGVRNTCTLLLCAVRFREASVHARRQGNEAASAARYYDAMAEWALGLMGRSQLSGVSNDYNASAAVGAAPVVNINVTRTLLHMTTAVSQMTAVVCGDGSTDGDGTLFFVPPARWVEMLACAQMMLDIARLWMAATDEHVARLSSAVRHFLDRLSADGDGDDVAVRDRVLGLATEHGLRQKLRSFDIFSTVKSVKIPRTEPGMTEDEWVHYRERLYLLPSYCSSDPGFPPGFSVYCAQNDRSCCICSIEPYIDERRGAALTTGVRIKPDPLTVAALNRMFAGIMSLGPVLTHEGTRSNIWYVSTYREGAAPTSTGTVRDVWWNDVPLADDGEMMMRFSVPDGFMVSLLTRLHALRVKKVLSHDDISLVEACRQRLRADYEEETRKNHDAYARLAMNLVLRLRGDHHVADTDADLDVGTPPAL